jgi:hypothetical protein
VFRFRPKTVFAALSLWCAAQPVRVLACAACYGASDAPMAKGMNWGIFSLLGVIVSVLIGVASFFIYLSKRSKAGAAAPSAAATGRVRPEAKPAAVEPEAEFANDALSARSY